MRGLSVFLLLAVIVIGMIPPTVAKSIYTIHYTDLNGNTVSLDQYNGQKLVVEAFSSVCTHCIAFHPRLANMYEQYNSSLSLISISINPDDTAAKIKTFEQDHPTSWKIGLEKDDLNSAYSIAGTPTTMMFDRNGNMQVCIVGEVSQSVLNDHTEQFVSNSSYTYNVDNGKCPQPSAADQFFGSIYFPITMALIFYAGFFLIRKYFNNVRERTKREEVL